MRGMLLMIRAGWQASRHCELIWAGIAYCVLHTCVRSVAPMELGRMLALKWIIDTEYTNYFEITTEFPNVSRMRHYYQAFN